ncbi:protein phosphatase 2C domain-containing protein [Brachybacterium vulturis]|uniref:protein phosphatase 2C domain-containing protein n=1 Tax=Brachybacterium vulturis TaxID=2017484 RepID=UPI0037365797
MHTTLLTDPAIQRANEDAAGVLGPVAVVIDGAGVPSRFRAGCRHRVEWFSHVLAARLLDRAQEPTVPLRQALAGAITDVRSLHEGQCDLDLGGPSATVVAVRWGAEHLEHLVLCDSSLLLERADGTTRRLTDPRIEDVVSEEAGAEAIEARRNAAGGFWVARHEPEAAGQALVGRTALADLRAVHLVSDGITRAVDLLGLHDDSSLARALREDPGALLRRLRRAEAQLPAEQRPRKLHDDATVLTLRPDAP